MSKQIELFEITYGDGAGPEVGKGFRPLDNSKGPPEFREIVPIYRYLKEHEVSDSDWIGLLPSKFTEKTSLTGADIISEIERS